MKNFGLLFVDKIENFNLCMCIAEVGYTYHFLFADTYAKGCSD